MEAVCLIARVNLQLEPRLSGLRRVAKPALSGLLALLLLICGTLSVCQALHQLLHNDAAGSHHRNRDGVDELQPTAGRTMKNWVIIRHDYPAGYVGDKDLFSTAFDYVYALTKEKK